MGANNLSNLLLTPIMMLESTLIYKVMGMCMLMKAFFSNAYISAVDRDHQNSASASFSHFGGFLRVCIILYKIILTD